MQENLVETWTPIHVSLRQMSQLLLAQIDHALSVIYAFQNIDLARAKSEALVNNTYEQKKLNRVMLNGEGSENVENGIKINGSNQQKNKFARGAHFFSN